MAKEQNPNLPSRFVSIVTDDKGNLKSVYIGFNDSEIEIEKNSDGSYTKKMIDTTATEPTVKYNEPIRHKDGNIIGYAYSENINIEKVLDIVQEHKDNTKMLVVNGNEVDIRTFDKQYYRLRIGGNPDSKAVDPSKEATNAIIATLLETGGFITTNDKGEKIFQFTKEQISSFVNSYVSYAKDVKFTDNGVEIKGEIQHVLGSEDVKVTKEEVVKAMGGRILKQGDSTITPKASIKEFEKLSKDSENAMDLIRDFADALNVKGLEKVSKKGTDEQVATGLVEAITKKLGGNIKIDGNLTAEEAAEIEQKIAELMTKQGIPVIASSKAKGK